MNKTIMLVEDDPDDALFIQNALKKNNVNNEIIIASDGAEALDILFGTGAYADKGAPIIPTVILLDLHLPKIDGLEVLRRLRANEHTRLLPIVILTSSREEQDRLKGYNFGANSYVCKPVDFARFSEAVRQLGLYWVLLNEPPPLL